MIVKNHKSNFYSIKKPLLKASRNDFIIKPFGAGLGDNLWHSHLPHIAKKMGYDNVLISEETEYRDNDYKELIWDLNPYVDGYCKSSPYYNKEYSSAKNEFLAINSKSSEINILDFIMLYYGIDDGERLHNPEFYYKPIFINSLCNSTIYDPNYVSDLRIKEGNVYLIKETIETQIDYQFSPAIMNSNKIPFKDKIYGYLPQNLRIKGVPSITCCTFRDFCDVVYSVDNIFCFSTGIIVLCDAILKKCNVIMDENPITPIHSKRHNYILLKK